ncbi:MAG TPA: hypothetical protein VFS21_39100 [Roseiflexaceae bacterium]|nr:hypothetical protein [Roseiflexaceae bacterium]
MKYVVRIMLAFALALTVTLGRAGHAQAQAAKGAAWQSSITVLNVDAGPATINIDFYPGRGGTPISFQPETKLNAGAGTSYSLSSIAGINAGFKGSAIVYSDQRLVSTVVQFVPGGLGGKGVRPLSNGFQASDASPTYLLPTVLNNEFNTVTEFSIQNVETTAITATLEFYPAGATAPSLTGQVRIGANEAQPLDASTVGIPAKFNGSATIKAIKTSDNTPANIVVTVSEYNTTNSNASSVEAAKAGANTYYMPIALCNLSGPGTATSSYAIQNADTVSAAVTVRFYGLDRSLKKQIGPFTVQPGAKTSINGCTDAGLGDGFNGSAVIGSETGKIVAVGKVGGAGISSAFLGSETGAQVLALPYVRWSPDAQFQVGARQRTFIAIQNLSNDPADVVVSYRNKDGVEVAKKTYRVLNAGGKVNSNPFEAGAAPNGYFGEENGVFGGGAIITAPAGVKITAVARVVSGIGPIATGEDYNAIPIQ